MTVPNHREEPAIYSGKIFMMDGAQMGELVPTPYIVAQGLVANGQARWEGDDSPLPRQMAAVLAERRRKTEEAKAADDAHGAHMKALRENGGADLGEPAKVEAGDFPGARPLHIAEYPGNHVVILKPFPQHAEMSRELVENEDDNVVIKRVEDRIAMTFANANAIYQIVAENEEFIYAELLEANMPEIEIPADWKTRNHMVNVGAAKKLMALDNSTKMSKVDAEKVIEEWTTIDDSLPKEGAAEPSVPTNENGRRLDGNHPEGQDKDGNIAKTPEEIAAEAEAKFAADEDGD